MHLLFASLFPDTAAAETRVIHIIGTETGIPFGSYPIFEFYCTEKDCDCRQVYLHVMNPNTDMIEAEISYGWEPMSFYIKWNYDKNEDHLKEFKGPSLNALAKQGPYSKQWLHIISETLDTDKEYARRLDRHYRMVKNKFLGN